jgi:hypothetical protein
MPHFVDKMWPVYTVTVTVSQCVSQATFCRQIVACVHCDCDPTSCPLRHRLLTAPPWPAGAWSAPAARSCCLLVPPLFPPSRLPAGQAPGFVAAPPSLVAAPAHSAAGAQALGFVAALPSLVAAAIPPNPASFSLYEAVLLEKLLIALGLLP